MCVSNVPRRRAPCCCGRRGSVLPGSVCVCVCACVCVCVWCVCVRVCACSVCDIVYFPQGLLTCCKGTRGENGWSAGSNHSTSPRKVRAHTLTSHSTHTHTHTRTHTHSHTHTHTLTHTHTHTHLTLHTDTHALTHTQTHTDLRKHTLTHTRTHTHTRVQRTLPNYVVTVFIGLPFDGCVLLQASHPAPPNSTRSAFNFGLRGRS